MRIEINAKNKKTHTTMKMLLIVLLFFALSAPEGADNEKMLLDTLHF
jgi:hypothetical protein